MCSVIVQTDGLTSSYNAPAMKMKAPLPLSLLRIAADSCKLFIYQIEKDEQLETIFSYESIFQYKYDHHFAVIIEDDQLDVEQAFRTRILKHSHSLILLKPIVMNKTIYAAYVSNLQGQNPVELVALIDGDQINAKLFPEKMKKIETSITAAVTPYEPFVSVKSTNNTSFTFDGFEIEAARAFSRSLGTKTNFLSDSTYNYFFLFANLTGNVNSKFKMYCKGIFLYIAHKQFISLLLLGDPKFFSKPFPAEVPDDVEGSDVGFGAIYIYEHDFMKTFELSEPVWQDDECLLAGLPPPVKRSDTLILSFKPLVWALALGSIVISLSFLFIYTWITNNSENVSYGSWFIHIIAAFFQEPDMSLTKLKSDGIRIFLVIFMSMTFILATAYAGTLTSFLSIPPKSPKMKSLKDVAESSLSLVQIQIKDTFSSHINEYKKIIISRTFEHATPPTLLDRVINRDLIYFGSRDFMWFTIGKGLKRYNSLCLLCSFNISLKFSALGNNKCT